MLLMIFQELFIYLLIKKKMYALLKRMHLWMNLPNLLVIKLKPAWVTLL